MPKLHTTPGKAIAQIERRDADKANQYRAELKYFHVKARAILGFTDAYAVVDEVHTIPARRKLDILNQGTLDLLRGQ
ncbi:hypothetical protein [Streptomyces sp. DHE17-7]|uniref:hypothetical protein n=1 Tax=Streptomyces sp. DHE17-7 TaxID=2759949 RepID=UPI000EC0EB8C|nr:hypothetical protein [Streptomyces sp. DHE17-7]MBJ6623660.1 hypothetical protein [Streptomyces sp. DHE17-7]RIH58424.1 hypothetical protein D3C59_35230 [Streptomyces sp. SHP22-7]RIH58445.1 hypothetical protein D3C59_35155 [Streptomyces sp. SHP22-7]RIH58700.1 hypothetical protein D3C59_33400 [Streptomyces sp. SHP22-7]